MKIDRLIGILATLQQHGKVTAPYLAEKFKVSRQTIRRDVEEICRAGIPIVSTQGKEGGLSLMEGFSLDPTLFTRTELSDILTGLHSPDSVSRHAAGSPEKEKPDSHMTGHYQVTALYQPGVKDRLVEKNGPDSYTELPDGRLYTRWGFSSPEKALPWFLSFGDQVQVTDPPEMVESMCRTLSSALKGYPQGESLPERRTYSVLLDYLERYGQVTPEEAPLNDVDRLIFAQTAYLDFSQACSLQGAPLRDVLRLVRLDTDHPTGQRFSFQQRDDRALCSLLMRSSRYKSVCFAGFECTQELESDGQFAVLSLLLPDGALLICFRGTDNSLAGWKEDFDLCFCEEVPAQRRARLYVETRAEKYPCLELCGHSKGGNLALYAAAHCPQSTQDKLRCAVSFDGPGLSRKVVESDGFLRAQDRMRLLLPRSSLVGRLFFQPENVRVVECSVLSLLQHYPYTWKTNKMDFLEAESVSRSSQKISRTVCGLLERLPLATRRQFVEAVYEIVCATGAQTLNELAKGWLRNTPNVVRKLLRTDRENVKLLLPVLRAFWLSLGETMGLPVPDEEKTDRPGQT